MVLRWTAAAVLEAVKGVRRPKGHKDTPKLVAALRARDQQLDITVSVGGRRVECHVTRKITSASKTSWPFENGVGQMSVRRIVPDIKSKDLDASRQFYVDVLGLEVAMDMGFIVTLVSPSNPTAQVSLMRDDGSSSILPQISIEVADVDDVHSRAVSRGLHIVYPLTNEPWGVRRFFVTDPDGTVINVMCHIGGAKSG
jgi:catechol 2,3-dioxygenase-like lactoylglutathione lyase family enzyme